LSVEIKVQIGTLLSIFFLVGQPKHVNYKGNNFIKAPAMCNLKV
jgi:hypothetical protein